MPFMGKVKQLCQQMEEAFYYTMSNLISTFKKATKKHAQYEMRRNVGKLK